MFGLFNRNHVLQLEERVKTSPTKRRGSLNRRKQYVPNQIVKDSRIQPGTLNDHNLFVSGMIDIFT